MHWDNLEKCFSRARLERYRSAQGGDQTRAVFDYTSNILLAEAMVPMLNVVEIALRNRIHARLSILYNRNDWWEMWIGDPTFTLQNREIKAATVPFSSVTVAACFPLMTYRVTR